MENNYTLEGSFANKTVRQKNGTHVLNLVGQTGNREVIRIISYLFGPLRNVGKVKSAGDKYLWIPGSASKEKNPTPRVVTLPALLARLNEAQTAYRFELVYGTLLRVKELG